MEQEGVFFKNSKQESIVGILHTPDRETDRAVILLHGMFANKDQEWIKSLSLALVKEGIVVLRFDRSGNGESDGQMKDATILKGLDDTRSSMKFLKEKGIEQFFLIGHSMGAALALLLGASEREIKGIVSIGCPSNFEKPVHSDFIRGVFKKYELDEDQFLMDAKAADVLLASENLNCPVLFINGDHDTVVDVDDAYELAERAKDKHIEIVNGLDHFFSRYDDEVKVVDLCKKFILNKIL